MNFSCSTSKAILKPTSIGTMEGSYSYNKKRVDQSNGGGGHRRSAKAYPLDLVTCVSRGEGNNYYKQGLYCIKEVMCNKRYYIGLNSSKISSRDFVIDQPV